MKTDAPNNWDVIVIGGGPAGMMSAGKAGERGLRVLLLEKNKTLGKKLLITGGGRCNLTNAEFDTRKLLEKYETASKYLFSAFSQWDSQNTISFFHDKKMPTKIEALGRVFPESNSAESVWNVLVAYMKENNVTVMSDTTVTGFETKENTITGVVTKNKGILRASNYILATGGKSRPETGSTGDGFVWLADIGHTVTEPRADLVPITVSDAWVHALAGVTLPMAKITVIQDGTKYTSAKGKVLCTHKGLSGPTILNMSGTIQELLQYGDVSLVLDILPQFDHGQLNSALQTVFKNHSNKKIKNSLGEIILPALVPMVLEKTNIDPETESHSITREERLRLTDFLKQIPIAVTGVLGTDKAIVTSGGVSLDEVDFRTMQSRLFPNLFLIGDILNIDRPSGGYSLQLCWTTGMVAGNAVDK